MLRIGINGFGRIGRAIFRNNLKNRLFQIVAINDINPDIDNIVYQLNYDTLYGQLEQKFHAEDSSMVSGTARVRVFNQSKIDEVDWDSYQVDLVIDASGILDNVLRARKLLEKSRVSKIIVTHSPEEVDFTMVLGANEQDFMPETHHIIASSICDATAIAPVLKVINENFGIESGHLTTLHPCLGYQNLMDGPASSWAVPGEIYHHFALGRSAIGNMIPKPTSALSASCKVLKDINPDNIGSYSMRTPTQIVGAADITLHLSEKTRQQKIFDKFYSYAKSQRWKIIENNFDPLVSLDFKGSEYSANIDHRFTSLVNGNMLKLLLWYDNEWGYAARVCDQVNYIRERCTFWQAPVYSREAHLPLSAGRS